jgi:hypothetical protein
MAFGGVLLSGFAFIVLLILILIVVVNIIAFIVLTIVGRNNDSRVIKFFQMMTGYTLFVFIMPLIIGGVIVSIKKKNTIEYHGKEVKVDEKIIDKFYTNISFCDIDTLNKLLKKYPELFFSKTDGLYPLGYSIKYKQYNCIKYFVDKGSDVNKPSESWGTLEYMFHYSYYDEDVLDYVLSVDNIDINKRHKAIPVAQLYLKSIIKDKEITEKEASYFEKLVSMGLDLKDTNGSNIDTYTYIDSLNDIKGLNKIKKILDIGKP